jgi:hypothetical protein
MAAVQLFMASRAQGDQIRILVRALLTTPSLVVNLQIVS